MRDKSVRGISRGYLVILAVLAFAASMTLLSVRAQAAFGDKYNVNVKGTFHYQKVYPVLADINRQRKSDPLSLDESLMQSAMQRAAELALLYNNDVRPNMDDALKINQKAAASSILYGVSDAETAYRAFYASARSRANMLNYNYKSMGIGCFSTGGNYYWAMLFSTQNSGGINVHQDVTRTVTVQVVENGVAILKSGIAGREADSISLFAGKTVEVTPLWADRSSGLPTDTITVNVEDSTFNWTTSDPSVALVDQKGLIKAVGSGTAVITAVPRIGTGSGLHISVIVKKNTITSTLKKTVYVWTGKKITPEVVVKRGKKVLQEGTDYTVTYKKNKKVGYGRVIVSGKGKYEDQTETLLFKILPARPNLTARAQKSKIRLSWKKDAQVTGYEIQVSTSKRMKEDLILEEAPGNQQKLTIKKLESGETYYVRMREYKTVSGERLYSKWSKKIKVTTK